MDKKNGYSDRGQRRIIDFKRIWIELVKHDEGPSVLHHVGVILSGIILAALCGSLLLIGVYYLPVHRIDKNVEASAPVIQNEGTYYNLTDWSTSRLDNFTDSLMLLESACDAETSPVTGAMNATRGSITEHNPAESLVDHYINGMDFDKTVSYPRYWHGYQIVLKPLLEFLDYSSIRIFNGIVQAFLVILTCFMLIKKARKAAIIPYILSYFMLMPLALSKSMQFSSCFYVFTLGSLALLWLSDDHRREKAYIVFLYCGICTAFFDYLTYPITTFGVPMVFYLLMMSGDSSESNISSFIKNGLSWAAGYGGMWSLKWVIASIVTGTNVITNGLEAVTKRTSSFSPDGLEKYSILTCEIKNYKTFMRTPVSMAVVLCVIYLLYRCVRKRHQSFYSAVRTLLPFLLTGLMPAIWYAFATNHSMVHFWFTNKGCVVSVLALLFGLVCLSHTDRSRIDQVNGSSDCLK